MVSEGGQPEDEKVKISRLKELVLTKPETAEAESGLFELYSIVRSDYIEDKFKEKNGFYNFLE